MVRATGPSASAFLFQQRHEFTNRRQELFTAIASARADRVLSISSAVSRAILAAHVRPAKLREVGNGIVATHRLAVGSGAEDRRRLGIDEGDVVIVCVARIRAGKGHDVLIEACALLAGRGEDALGGKPLHLVLVGDGPEAAAVARHARSAPGFDCHLIGWVDDTERWVAVADVVVVPSLTEAFGKSAAEAMASGVPLVASRVGGLVELLDEDRNGIAVAPGDAGDLASAIGRTLADPEATAARAKAARKAYEDRYTIPSMVERWNAVYAELVSR